MSNKKLTYEFKEAVTKEVDTGVETGFGGTYNTHEVVGEKWVKVSVDYDDENYKFCKEQVAQGKCRNLKVVEVQ